ncbi:MAG: hypothetical protein QOE05_1469 [Actinomycetota bacterium]|nr:hypothetical protein [Actinomycetota bacterium]
MPFSKPARYAVPTIPATTGTTITQVMPERLGAARVPAMHRYWPRVVGRIGDGSSDVPDRNASTADAAERPSAIAHTISD